jgi:hypothetical protein
MLEVSRSAVGPDGSWVGGAAIGVGALDGESLTESVGESVGE